MHEFSKAMIEAKARRGHRLAELRAQLRALGEVPVRVVFEPVPGEPTIRRGAGTILRLYLWGHSWRVDYMLDEYHPGRTLDCDIETLMRDNPRRAS